MAVQAAEQVKQPLSIGDLRTLLFVEAAATERDSELLFPGGEPVILDVSQYQLPEGYESVTLDWGIGFLLVFRERRGDDLCFEATRKREATLWA